MRLLVRLGLSFGMRKIRFILLVFLLAFSITNFAEDTNEKNTIIHAGTLNSDARQAIRTKQSIIVIGDQIKHE